MMSQIVWCWELEMKSRTLSEAVKPAKLYSRLQVVRREAQGSSWHRIETTFICGSGGTTLTNMVL